MNAQNTKYLYDTYPGLYRQHSLPMNQTAMCWGFDCGDGWFDIINRLSKKIVSIDPSVQAVQVKEKFATLRFYVDSATDEVFDAIEVAEAESESTCEACGQPGKLRGRGWLKTRCDECWKNGDGELSDFMPGCGYTDEG